MAWIATGQFTETGAVAWRRADGTWSRAFAEAGHVDEAAAITASEREIVSIYKIELGDDGQPRTTRERIRANGPTIRIGS
jgi:hypothetical protein